MYYFLSLLTGILISVMLVCNGALAEQYGLYSAVVIIHMVGLTFITAAVLLRRERLFSARHASHAWFLYLGGAIGVFTTLFNNFAFGRISVSAIQALSLFGQSIAGLVIDQYGLLGMARHQFSRRKLAGLALIFAGIVSMINNFEIAAVALSAVAGANVVVSRTLNARLAKLTSVRIGTFYNYIIGLAVSLLVFVLLGSNETVLTKFAVSTETLLRAPNWHIYLGGALGASVILISNITVMRISAFYLTLLLFIGQIFSGVLLDVLISGALVPRSLVGGILVTMGLSVNLLLDKKKL